MGSDTADIPGGSALQPPVEAMVPQVVAVIVTCDPGEWFEEGLAALAAQDYPELSVLVLDAGSRDGLTKRVASVLPDAYVSRLETNTGFGAGANSVLGMVEGASHFLLCHDDVAPDPDTVSILVEESFRSNAGVVVPKLVGWEDPRRLLHVGLSVDKGGAMVDRVEPGEIDHGQHDAVRDVFATSGGCTLVRADLFSVIGGFDPQIFAIGEDLDLCWRAQVAGARVVVAPAARVRHLELLARRQRPLPEEVHFALPSPGEQPLLRQSSDKLGFRGSVWRAADAASATTRASATTAASSDAAASVLTTALAHADPGSDDGGAERGVGPGAATLVADHGSPATEGAKPSRRFHLPHSTRTPHRRTEHVTLYSLQRRHELRAVLKNYGLFHRIRVVPQLILLSIGEILVALLGGQRERAFAVVHAWRWNFTERKSLRSARAVVARTRRLDDAEVRRLQLHGSARLNAYVRRAVVHGVRAARLGVHEDAHASEHDGSVAESTEEIERRRVARTTRAGRALVWTAVGLILIFGSRGLLGSSFPYIGQFVPFSSWGTFLHRFWSGWQPSGVGMVASVAPGTGLLGVGGLLLGGSTGLLQKVVVLGCIPVGAVGASRLMSDFGSVRVRLTAALVYLAIPLPYDALATARWDALLAYAASPWIVVRLARASRDEPYSGLQAERRLPAWRTRIFGRALGLGILVALLTSVAPTSAALTLVLTAGLALGCLVTGGRSALRSAGRVAVVGVGATLVAAVLLLPWSVSVLEGPARWEQLAGLASAPVSGPGFASLLHLGVGPIGDTVLAWGFCVAALLPLLLGTGPRLVWAGRSLVLALTGILLAWAAGHGWLGAFRLPSEMLLSPAAVGVSMSAALGVASFESDVARREFGWRQGAAGLCALCAALAFVPALAASLSGRWEMPTSGYGQATSWMSRESAGDFRVLWVGDPGVLPGGAWQVAPGLAYGLSEQGTPDALSLWPGSSPGPAAAAGTAVGRVAAGQTNRMGRLIAPYAVRYVVVVGALAPSMSGAGGSLTRPLPPALLSNMQSQVDMRQVISQPGFDVYVDDEALPQRGEQPVASAPGAKPVRPPEEAPPASSPLPAYTPVLPAAPGASSVTGKVARGSLYAAVAPPAAWELAGPGETAKGARTAFGYASGFAVQAPAEVTVRYVGSWRHGLAMVGEIALWIVALGALAAGGARAGRSSGSSSGRRRARRKHRRGPQTYSGDRSQTAPSSPERAGVPQIPNEVAGGAR